MKIINTAETARGKLLYTLYAEDNGGSERYRISVLSKIFGEVESASVSDITSDPAFAQELLFILADNLVLPSTLSEVVEEYISSRYTV